MLNVFFILRLTTDEIVCRGLLWLHKHSKDGSDQNHAAAEMPYLIWLKDARFS
jgi:hypothetical protein